MNKHSISKSQYIMGLGCERSLWIYRNDKDRRPEITAQQETLFNFGHQITEMSMQYFGGAGVEVTNEYWDISGAVASTEQFIADGNKIIFEATAINPNNGTYASIDILKKVDGSDEWDMIEVKASTSVKDYHKDDMSFQYQVFTNAGYKIRKCFMMIVNNQYVKDGDIDPTQLLKMEEITDIAIEKQDGIETRIENLVNMIKGSEEPEICETPHKCDYCSDEIDDYSVYNLFSKAKVGEIVDKYGDELVDLPPDIKINGAKVNDLQAYLSGEPIVNPSEITKWVKKIEYPIYYLDYETMNTPIPLFDGTRPYQQITFQFSLHIQQEKGGELEHLEFLYEDQSDPREEFAKYLVQWCGDRGSVIVYNQAFEETRNKELARDFPQYADALNNISNRMVDLLIPFKKRWLYHPNQKSSASIKAVLPCFTKDSDYKKLNIQDGGQAMEQYTKFAMGLTPKSEVNTLMKDLKEYCELDTKAMVLLLDVLYEKIN